MIILSNKRRIKFNFSRSREEKIYIILALPFSGVMDKRNYLIANKLINNNRK